MSQYEMILYRLADKVARITLNAPEKRHPLRLALRRELVDALKWRDDPFREVGG